MMASGRVVSDCRKVPSENKCTLTIAGTEDEVMKVAVRHAVEDHGDKDTPELRQMIKDNLDRE